MLTLPDCDPDPETSRFGRPPDNNAMTNGLAPTKEALVPQDDAPFLEFVGCFLW